MAAAAAGLSRPPASYAHSEYVPDVLKAVFRQGPLTKFDMWVGQTFVLRSM